MLREGLPGHSGGEGEGASLKSLTVILWQLQVAGE